MSLEGQLDPRHLPLTAPRRDSGRAVPADKVDLVPTLVEEFYSVARRDDLLGPVFERYVSDWPAHLERMVAFWSSAVFRTGSYSGRPFEVHRRIVELSPTHFERWLALWRETVRAHVPQPEAGQFEALAERMAVAMQDRLGRSDAIGA